MRSRLIARLAALALVLSPAAGMIATPASAQTAPATASAPVSPVAPAPAPAPAVVQALPQITPPDTNAATDNPYGLGALWAGGDFVARGVLVILAILSAGSWYILFTKLYEQPRLFAAAREADKNFWSGGKSLKDNLASLNAKGAFHFVASNGLSAAAHHEGTLVEHIDLNTWVGQSIQRSVDKVSSRLSGGLAFLATVGSTAPFIGLFGTVWGIYHALVAIGIAGQASIDKVAGPVGEALIMTAIGLAVAVPAVLSYNWLVRRNKAALEQLRNFGADLHGVLLSRVNAPATTTSRAA